MRRSRPVATWLLLAALVCVSTGCRVLDATQPIALVPDADWNALEVGILADAAQCWNLQFGTQLSVDRQASTDQQVRVDYSDAACLAADALTIAVAPLRISVCPVSYIIFEHPKRSQHLMTVLLHEIGHALSILGHASEYQSVMHAHSPRPDRFSDEDRAMFVNSNADALPSGGCATHIPAVPVDDSTPYDPDVEGCACGVP